MATVAELRMDVDSRPVKNAGRDLDQLAKTAERTERATNKLGDGARRASGGVKQFADNARNAGREVGSFDTAIGRSIGRVAAFSAGIIGVGAALRGMFAGLQAADNFRAIDNRIKLVTKSAEEFAQVQQGLIRISRDTFASVEGTVQAYQRMAGATDRLGISQERLLGIAETVNKAVALSGATSQAAEASLIQFGQALSNNFQASSQEINSLNEQVFALSDAIARGITKVTGIETFRSDLKKMAESGKLSSALVIEALEAVKEETDDTFNGLDRTFAQVAQRLKTNAQVIAKDAFGPLLNVKIDFYTRFAAALEDPRTILAAQKFGATLVDIARGVEANADKIGKAFTTIATAGGILAAISAVQALRGAVIALGVAVASNPVGLLVTSLAAAVGLIVAFRDEITAALTPFKSFKDLASAAAPIFRGLFEYIKEAAGAVAKIFADLERRFSSLISAGEKVRKLQSASDPLQFNQDAARRRLDAANKAGGLKGVKQGAIAAVEFAGGFFADKGRRAIAEEKALDASISGFLEANKAAKDYSASVERAADETKKLGAAAPAISKVAGSLRDGAAEAARLFEAAKGGQLRFDSVSRAIEIEKAAIAAVAKAKEAGEELSLATAKLLITKERDLLDAAQSLLDAEKRLRERAAQKAGEIADGVSAQIDRALDRSAGNVPLSGLSVREMQAAAHAFGQTLQEQLDFLASDATIGIDPDTLLELQKRIKEAGQDHADKIEDALREGGRQFTLALQNTFGTIFDDLLFNGGRGLGDLFRNALRSIGSEVFSKPLSKFLSGDGTLFGNLTKSFKDLTGNFAKAGSQIAASISKSLAGAGAAIGGALGGALAGFSVGKGLGDLLGLGKGSTGRRTLTGAATGAGVGAALGSVIPGVGTAIGAAVGAIAGAIGGALSGLFGRKTATGSVDLASGTIGGVKNSKKEGGERNERRDTILNSVSEVAKQFAEALGATIKPGISLLVEAGKKSITTTVRDAQGQILGTATAAKDDVQGAFSAALKIVIEKAFSGGDQTLKDFANSALAAGRSIEEIIAVLNVLKDVTNSGKKALADYALVAAKAGRSADQIVQGVEALARVYALTEKPLSEIAQQLKNIDDAINPVIADLKSLGQSFAEIEKIGKDAAKALGENFLQGIRDLNIDLQNTVFGQFNRLLEEIRKREEDATLLFKRGAITSDQLGFVKSTSGLQVSKFFEGLSDDDKESLADFLGLLRTASGDIAVARVKLEEQFTYLIDNVEETARNFEEAARNFERLSQNLRQTADAIRTEFSGLTPRDNVVSLQGRVQTLLNQARDEKATTQSRQSALEALPQTVNSLVQAARQAFGGTDQFANIRDFGLKALDDSATLADSLAKFNQEQADAARADVKLLTDIKELLNDDRQLPTLQKILDEGKLSNILIAQQLQAFLTLMGTAGSNLNQITAQQLQDAAAAYLSQQQQAIASVSQPAPRTTAVSTTQQGSLTNEQVVQALADNATANARLASSNANIADKVDDLAVEIRRLVTRLAA